MERRALLVALTAGLAAAGRGRAQPGEILVFAAASLTEALQRAYARQWLEA